MAVSNSSRGKSTDTHNAGEEGLICEVGRRIFETFAPRLLMVYRKTKVIELETLSFLVEFLADLQGVDLIKVDLNQRLDVVHIFNYFVGNVVAERKLEGSAVILVMLGRRGSSRSTIAHAAAFANKSLWSIVYHSLGGTLLASLLLHPVAGTHFT